MATYLKYANFTCKFGDTDLLENVLLFENVVWTAFQETEARRVDETFYKLDNIELVTIDDGSGNNGTPILAIAGYLVKSGNEKIGRQYDSLRGYYEDPNAQLKYQTALFFTLILNSHRMIYYRPSLKAPTIKTFRTTMRHFLRTAHDNYIRSLKTVADDERSRDESLQRVTLTSLREEFPIPTLNIEEISGEGTLESALEKFKIINRAKFVLLNANADLDLNGIHAVRDLKDQAKSNETVLTHENKSTDGLDKNAILDQADEAAKFGNTQILLDGSNLLGDRLKIDNGTFAAKTPFSQDILDTRSGAKSTAAIFLNEVQEGRLKSEDHSARFSEELIEIRDRLRNR